jgi:hypothetical protein
LRIWRRGSDRPQHGEFPRPLGDRHPEDVGDHEGADEQRHRGEHQDEGADEPDRVLEALHLLAGEILGRDRLESVTQSASIRSATTARPSSATTSRVE